MEINEQHGKERRFQKCCIENENQHENQIYINLNQMKTDWIGVEFETYLKYNNDTTRCNNMLTKW